MKKLILLVPIFASCSWMAQNPDSFPEELVEEVIDRATGLDIDLTSTDGKR